MQGPFLSRKDHDHAPKIRLNWYLLFIALAMFWLWYRCGHIYFFKRETRLERIHLYVLSWNLGSSRTTDMKIEIYNMYIVIAESHPAKAYWRRGGPFHNISGSSNTIVKKLHIIHITNPTKWSIISAPHKMDWPNWPRSGGKDRHLRVRCREDIREGPYDEKIL